MLDIKVIKRIQRYGKYFRSKFPAKFKKIKWQNLDLPPRDFNRWLLSTYPSVCDCLKRLSAKRIGWENVFPFLNVNHNFKCLECGSLVKAFNQAIGLPNEFCSNKCVNASSITSQRRTGTIQDRYGVENAFQSEVFKEKSRQTLRRKYGVESNISQSAEIQERIRQTSRRKRGVDHHTQAVEVKAKTKLTNNERYGCDNVFQNKQVQARQKQTVQDRYGVDNVFQLAEVQNHNRKLFTAKYGADNPMHVPAIFSKCSLSKSNKELKIFNTVLPVHGAEAVVLKTLEPKIKYISIDAEEIPHVRYRLGEKLHYYYPDALVKTNSGKTWVVEVKSTYYLSCQSRRNTFKFRAASKLCRKLGHVFKVAVLVEELDYYYIYWFTSPSSVPAMWAELRIYHPNLIQGEPRGQKYYKSKVNQTY